MIKTDFVKKIGAVGMLLMFSASVHAQEKNQLEKIEYSIDANNHVIIVADFSVVAPTPSSFITDSPVELAIDLPNTTLSGGVNKYMSVGLGEVDKIELAQVNNRARLVINLKDKTNYQITPKADKLFIDIANPIAPVAQAQGAGTPAPQDGQPQVTQPAVVSPMAAMLDLEKIIGVDFKKGDKDTGKIILDFTDFKNKPDVHEDGNNLILLFKNTSVNTALVKRFDVLDFATPVKFFDVLNKDNNAEIIITTYEGHKYTKEGYNLGNQYVLELHPDQTITRKYSDTALSLGPYKGDRITLAFQNVDIRALLQIIANVAQSNIIISDSVNGQMAINLKNVRWDQALDVILRTKGLGVRKKDNVMLIAPIEELANREKVEQEAEKAKVELAPLHSEIIQVNYAKASVLAGILKAKDNTILSQRGSVSVDDRTNTVLIQDTQSKIDDIKTLIDTLDRPVRQVLIEARIVVAKDSFDKEIGAQFGITGIATSGNNLATTSGTGNSTNTTITNITNPSSSTSGTNVVDGNINDRYNVNLPVSSPAGSLALAILSKNTLIDLELSALQSEGKSETVSTPHVITANAKTATISQGVEIPYQESSSAGATTIAFKDAVLSLQVTPQITPDDRIIMDLAVNNDSVGANVPTGTGGTVPSIDTRKVKSQVLVDNGQTVVLGGIYEIDKEDQVTKVPYLGDIPYLGILFRNTVHSNTKTELLVFITPKIIEDQINIKSATPIGLRQ